MPLHASTLQPRRQILALAHVERAQLMAAVDNGFNPNSRHPHAPSDRELAQLEQVQADAAEGGVADGAAAEGEVEAPEVRASEGEDLGGGVGEGAAEGLLSSCVSNRRLMNFPLLE